VNPRWSWTLPARIVDPTSVGTGVPSKISRVKPTGKFALTCPDCGSELVIDAETGTVISHRAPEAPRAGGKDFDALLAGLDAGKARAEELFERERAALADKDRLLEEKFKEAMKRAQEEPDLPPKRPFDLD